MDFTEFTEEIAESILPQISQINTDGFFQGVHLSPLGFAACQSKKCTNKARCTPTEQIDAPTEQDRFFQGVHLSPLGFAACQSKKCTNKARCAPTEQVGALETSAPP